jgi:carbon-monoxide dehydrogenase medium subunit
MMATALQEHEILAAIEVAPRQTGEGMSYAKLTHPASRYAVVGAAATVVVKDGACTAARVSIGGVVPAAVRVPSVERALAGARPSAGMIGNAAQHVLEHLGADVLEDIYASAEYRKAMAVVFVKRAVSAAFDRAT